MSYCINPKCPNPQNPDHLEHCQTCGASLLINDRYRVTKPLRPSNPASPTDIYEVKDWGGVDDWVSLKILKVLKFNNNPDIVRLFQQEARVLMFLRLKELGIPTVEPDGYFTFSIPKASKKLHCLVMEKIEGENLANWLELNGPISLEDALEWLQQLTEILDKVHSQNLLHRDIKPSNIILRPNGRLALIDFGTVGVGDWGSTRVGTTGYAAPEQVLGDAKPQSDFFALGRTFVHLLTGISPMDFPADPKTGNPIWRNSAKTLNWKQPAATIFADLIDELMHPAPEKRPRNTQKLLKKLAKIESKIENFTEVKNNYDIYKLQKVAALFLVGLLSFNAVNEWEYISKVFDAYFINSPDLYSKEKNKNIFISLGTEYYDNKNFDKAAFSYNLALMFNPNSAPAQYSLGRICEERQDLECAKNKYQIASQGNTPNAASAAISSLSRLHILEDKNSAAAAIELLTPHLERPTNVRIKASLYKNLGWAELIENRYNQAEKHLRQAIALKDQDEQYKEWSSPHCLLAQVLEVKGKKTASLQEWNNCLQYVKSWDSTEETIWQMLAKQRLNQTPKP